LVEDELAILKLPLVRMKWRSLDRRRSWEGRRIDGRCSACRRYDPQQAYEALVKSSRERAKCPFTKPTILVEDGLPRAPRLVPGWRLGPRHPKVPPQLGRPAAWARLDGRVCVVEPLRPDAEASSADGSRR
jgi:hypothetical protein